MQMMMMTTMMMIQLNWNEPHQHPQSLGGQSSDWAQWHWYLEVSWVWWSQVGSSDPGKNGLSLKFGFENRNRLQYTKKIKKTMQQPRWNSPVCRTSPWWLLLCQIVCGRFLLRQGIDALDWLQWPGNSTKPVQDWASVKAPRGNTWSSFVSDFDDTTYDLIDDMGRINTY